MLAGIPLVTAPAVFRTTPASGALPPLEQLGASVLGDAPSADPADYAVDDWGWLTPDPERAGEDRPSADVDRCQVDERSSEPVRCEFGVRDGAVTIALVGDSKALQWLPALERVAPGKDWRIVTYGKSSCAFAEGTTELSKAHYASCDRWNEAVARQLAADPPDLVVTSTQADAALRGERVSESALVDYLTRRWKGLQRAGVPVAVIGDNPGSPSDLDSCMARNPTQLTRCAFDRGEAMANTGLDAQRAAALQGPGVEVIDLTPWICPVDALPGGHRQRRDPPRRRPHHRHLRQDPRAPDRPPARGRHDARDALSRAAGGSGRPRGIRAGAPHHRAHLGRWQALR